MILTKGIRTTAGSKILEKHIPTTDAKVVELLLKAGGTIVGKTNTHEFACGATNTSSIAGPARNPNDLKRISGGSSGGSAVAVAAGLVDVALGTDTAGSVRTPSALCGVIGFKPTIGAISTIGVIPLSRTFDTVGIISKSFELIRRTFNTIMSSRFRVRKTHSRVNPDLRLGSFLFGDYETSLALSSVLRKISSKYRIQEVDMDDLRSKGSDVRRTITYAEAAEYHREWFSSRSEDYFPDVRRTLQWGTNVKAAQYIQSVRFKQELTHEYDRKMRDIDVLLSPTTRVTAPLIDEVIGHEIDFRDQLIGNTELFNLVGTPSVTIPISRSDKMPIGLMLSGRVGDDDLILTVAERIASLLS